MTDTVIQVEHLSKLSHIGAKLRIESELRISDWRLRNQIRLQIYLSPYIPKSAFYIPQF